MRPPLLFVPGAFSQAAHFEPWLGYFRGAGFRCAALSLPGHEPFDAERLRTATTGDYLDALRQSATKLGGPPVLVGHSMGGWLSLILAADLECAGVVAVATPMPGRWPARINGLRYALPLLPRILAGQPVSPAPGAARALAVHDLAPAEQDEIVSLMGMESGHVLRDMALGRPKAALRRIACPVLCISGGKDRVAPRSAGYRIAASVQGEHIVFPGQGHWLIAGSLTGKVAAAVREWLERHFGRA